MHVPLNLKAVLVTLVAVLGLILGSVIADLQARVTTLEGDVELLSEVVEYLLVEKLEEKRGLSI
ncbi:MAG: hypothetical protein HRU02_15775 [Myxococcales bacterium]|nr:hypothetical protein [Myxococcales bacterium]